MPEEKCDFCEKEAMMAVHNLKNDVKKKMCQQHFGEFVSNGQSRLYHEFLNSIDRGR